MSSFPHWAIAVIAVLAFLALATFFMLLFVLLRRLLGRGNNSNHRNSVGSASPMMAHVADPQTSSPGIAVDRTALFNKKPSSSIGHRPPSVGDGVSTISHSNSAGESAPFSVTDAAIMADAFRKALRKPDFAGQPTVEEGESPDKDEELLNRELAEEGRDIRSVGSSRGVRVEALRGNG